MEKIYLTDEQAEEIAHVCRDAHPELFQTLYQDLNYYVDWQKPWISSIWHKVDKIAYTKRKYYDGQFDKKVMQLRIKKKDFKVLNKLMKLAGYKKIKEIEDDPTNPSGLIFSFNSK